MTSALKVKKIPSVDWKYQWNSIVQWLIFPENASSVRIFGNLAIPQMDHVHLETWDKHN